MLVLEMEGTPPQAAESWRTLLEQAPDNPACRQELGRRVMSLGRRLTTGATWLYAAGLVLMLTSLEWIGERHWLLATGLYVPPQAWLLPLLGLAPLAGIFRRSLLWWHLGCGVLVLGIYMDVEWNFPRPPKGRALTLMTNNIGQNNRQSITSFLREQDPDLVLLQEAGGRGRVYGRSFPEYQVVERAEFVLLSKLPIRGALPVELPHQGNAPVAARFEVEWDGQPLAVYAVHLPTPRRELTRLRGLGLLAALAGMGRQESGAGRFRQEIADSWARRIQLAEALIARLRQEPLPFLVAGDFNMPNHGYLYRLFSREWADAFEKRGRGYGWTFPGYSLNPLSGFGPWLRLDYCFAGRGFAVLDCRTETGRRSQHRAVAARFERVAELPLASPQLSDPPAAPR